MCLVINQNCKLFFTITSSQKDPDPGSGSEILDLQFEYPDPDPKLSISYPEHWKLPYQTSTRHVPRVQIYILLEN